MEKLRDEILQCEGTRADLLKWKLVIAGGVGAAGLGFAGSNELRQADLVLCVIPLVSVYVDLLCRHLALKMLVIGTFLAQSKPDDGGAQAVGSYEALASRARSLKDEPPTDADGRVPTRRERLASWMEVSFVGRRRGDFSAFDLEDWALSLSTVVLSIVVAAYGIALSSWSSLPFLVSAALGVTATALGNTQYVRRFDAVQRLARET